MTPQREGAIKGMLTARQVGERVGMSQWMVLKYARLKKLPCYRFSQRLVRFKHSDVEQFIERARE